MARSRGRLGVRARLHGGARALARFVLHGTGRGKDGGMRRLLLALTTLALVAPAKAFARGEFDPTTEFEQHEWIPIHLGPLNLSITKAVVYLMLGTAFTILLGLVLMRGKTLNRRQTVGEQIYEVAQVQVAEQGLPSKAMGRWFPYVATLMLFIWTVNILGFIPLPLTGETWHGIPVWGIYASTSSLSVTLALALLTFVFTHVEGVRWNGPVRYFKSWIPEAPKPLLAFIVESLVLAVFVVPVAAIFYIFEVVIVVTIQAFIFAALSAIYIGSAIEPEH